VDPKLIIFLAALVLVIYTLRRPSVPVALMVTGFPLIVLAVNYTRLESGAFYFTSLFATFGVLGVWLRTPSLRRLNTPFFWLFLALLGLLIIGSAYTPTPNAAQFKILLFVGTAFPLIVGGTLLTETERRMDELLLFMGLFAICSYVAHIVFIQSGSIATGNITRYGELGNPIFVSRSVGMGALTFIALCLNRRFKVALPLWLAAIAVGLYIMIFTASRGPLLAFIPALACAYMLRARRVLIGLFVAGFVGVISYIVLTQFAPAQVYDRLVVQTLQDPTGSGRVFLLKTGLEAGASSPLIGVGTGGFSYFLAKNDVRDYPHNIFIEMFADHGFLGVTLMIVMVALIVYLVIKGNRYRPYLGWRYDFVISVVVYGFVNAQLSGDLPGQTELWLGLGMLGGIVRQGEVRQQEHELSLYSDVQLTDE
jgi:O-antigen ligase